MFWGDDIIDDFLKEYGKEAGKRQLILRDEKTMSGKPHVGSLRSYVMHAVLSDVLTDRDVDNVFYYELNDTDAFDSVPSYVPAEWKEHLGKRLKDVPAPDGKSANYAEQFGKEYSDVLKDSAFNAEYYYVSSKYEAGEFDEYIKLALENKDAIREIYRTVSGSEKPESWYPCQVVCDKCGKIATTQVTGWDGKEVEYSCSAEIGDAVGCGFSGKKSPFGGNATMPWKVEWAAKFCVVKVDLEGAGKDHYAAGGSRHVSNRICKEIFERKHPFDVRHEFILLEGAKMSSSSGVGSTAVSLYELLPRYLFRFMMIQKDVMRTINFNPEGDTVPVLFDQYDEVCRGYFEGGDDVKEHKNRIFELAHFYEKKDLKGMNRFLPRFNQISFFVQMPHLDIEAKAAEMKGSALTKADKEELALRVEHAKKWLGDYSPEKYVFTVQEEVPAAAAELSAEQKKFLGELAGVLDGGDFSGEELHSKIHELKEASGIPPKEIFGAIYVSLLGKDSGPQAGWFLEALEKEFLVKRFGEISKS